MTDKEFRDALFGDVLEWSLEYNRVERTIEALLKCVDEALDIRLRAHVARVEVLVDLADITLIRLSRQLAQLEYYAYKECATNG